MVTCKLNVCLLSRLTKYEIFILTLFPQSGQTTAQESLLAVGGIEKGVDLFFFFQDTDVLVLS